MSEFENSDKKLLIKNIELLERNSSLEKINKSAISELDSLRSSLSKANSEIERISINYSLLEERASKISKYESEILSLSNSLKVTSQKLRAKDKLASVIKALKEEISLLKHDNKKLKSFEPEKLKKNLSDKKQEIAELKKIQSTYRKDLANFKEELRDKEREIKKLDKSLKNYIGSFDKALSEKDYFYITEDNKWSLRLTGFNFDDEEEISVLRIRCTNMEIGTSVLLSVYNDDGIPDWSSDIGVPEYLTKLAIVHMKSLKENKRLLNANEINSLTRSQSSHT